MKNDGPEIVIKRKPMSPKEKFAPIKFHNNNEMNLTPGLGMYPIDKTDIPQQFRMPKFWEVSNIMVSQFDGDRGVVRPLDSLDENNEPSEELQNRNPAFSDHQMAVVTR